ncbi:MAG: hypothetical protein HKN40_02105 [Winogradskyella sp.]|uniref:hypothetical protein n=1 Tax=Winogradskyella sp. TaxID=1883156 RepID=UPI0017BECD6B|nr:hypothetical protein [Winogradskyella sp.]
MATRAAILYFDPEKLEAISTYNHYDGYPEGLGAGLKKHYNDDFKANRIASEGYISYLDPETGDIEVSNPRDKDVDPDRMRLTDDMGKTAMDLAEMISSYGADYAYIWSPAIDEWMTVKGGSTKSMYNTIDQLMPELFGMGTNPENDPQASDFMTEWKSFLSENTVDETEFNFFKTILGKKYSDSEIETYLKSDSFKRASMDGDMEMVASNSSNWENEFFEFFDNPSNV